MLCTNAQGVAASGMRGWAAAAAQNTRIHVNASKGRATNNLPSCLTLPLVLWRRPAEPAPTTSSFGGCMGLLTSTVVLSLALRGSLPAKVAVILPPSADPAAVLPLWNAVRRCYPSEDAAIAAVKRNRGLLYPWVSCVENIEGSYNVLARTCGESASADILAKNPGVLICDPKRLELADVSEILGAANFIAALDRFSGPPLAVASLVLLVAVTCSSLAGSASVLPDGMAAECSAIARPAWGLIGASAFTAAVLNAVYASSRSPMSPK
jgi:hypothetical protein